MELTDWLLALFHWHSEFNTHGLGAVVRSSEIKPSKRLCSSVRIVGNKFSYNHSHRLDCNLSAVSSWARIDYSINSRRQGSIATHAITLKRKVGLSPTTGAKSLMLCLEFFGFFYFKLSVEKDRSERISLPLTALIPWCRNS